MSLGHLRNPVDPFCRCRQAICRWLITSLICLGLAACAARGESKNTNFGPGSQTAIVVWGLWALENQGALSWSLEPHWVNKAVAGRAPIHDKFESGGTPRFSVERQCLLVSSDPDCPAFKNWFVHEVRPGSYFLDYAAFRYAYTNRFNYYGEQQHRNLRPAARGRLKTGHSFNVKAGEIVYIGDFVFNLSHDLDFPIARIERNDEGARRALAAYRGITGNMIYRKTTLEK